MGNIKVGTVKAVKETLEDKVELYEDASAITLRRLEVRKDDTVNLHKICLSTDEAERLVSLLRELIKEIQDRGAETKRRQQEILDGGELRSVRGDPGS